MQKRGDWMKKVKKIAPVVCASIIAIILIFPIYVMLISSFKPITEIFNLELFPDLRKLTFQNYIEVFQSENFGLYIKNSFLVAVIVTGTALILHSMAGYALARLQFRGKQVIFMVIMSTMMIPFAVIMIPLFVVIKNMHLVNNLWGIILPMIPSAYGIFLFRQFYIGLPKELEEAARIDGCGYFGTFWRIAQPLAKPIAVTMAVAFFLSNWNNYLWPLIVAQDRELWLVQIGITSFKTEQTVAWNLVMAASVVSSLPTMILFFCFQNQIAAGIKTSGIKG